MKASELRVGNLVTTEYFPDFDKDGILVESINDKGINLSIEDDGRYPEIADRWIEPYYTFEQLYPIPLTEEWLLRFGFTIGNLENCYFKNWGENGIECVVFEYHYKGGFEFELGKERFKSVEYVHQIQNLYFALTGEELVYTS